MRKPTTSEEIFISERFGLIRDTYSWELRDYRSRAKGYCKRTWHVSFTQIAELIVERSAMPCATLDELRALYASIIPQLAIALEESVRANASKQTNSMGRGDEPAAVLSGGGASGLARAA